jgi:hypothetical protein
MIFTKENHPNMTIREILITICLTSPTFEYFMEKSGLSEVHALTYWTQFKDNI